MLYKYFCISWVVYTYPINPSAFPQTISSKTDDWKINKTLWLNLHLTFIRLVSKTNTRSKTMLHSRYIYPQYADNINFIPHFSQWINSDDVFTIKPRCRFWFCGVKWNSVTKLLLFRHKREIAISCSVH